MNEHIKHVTDWGAAITAFAALLEYAPRIAAVMSITWMTYRFIGWLIYLRGKYHGKGRQG